MDEKNDNIAKKIYIKILIVLFSVSSVIAIGGKIVKQILRGYGYVFHSWLNVTYLVAWVLMIGLILIIPFTYLNVWLMLEMNFPILRLVVKLEYNACLLHG